MKKPILVGAVIYDPKVSIIWDIITSFFAAEGCPIDCVYYTNYELQVSALVERHIDIAWNSPLAWVDAQARTGGRCRAVAMRDTDRDRISHIVVRSGGGVQAVADLRGRVLATGAIDSPQATLLPIEHLRRAGLAAGVDYSVRRHDLLVGKHGDHVGGEREALRALESGQAEAAAMLDLNWETWCADGTIDPRRLRILGAERHRPALQLADAHDRRVRAHHQVRDAVAIGVAHGDGAAGSVRSPLRIHPREG